MADSESTETATNDTVPSIVVSCVLDKKDKFSMQCFNWLASLAALGTHQRVTILVHHTPEVDARHLALFRRMGATLVPIEPFGAGAAAYCNKLRQLETEAVREADYTVLCDTDLAFLQCPTRLARGQTIRGKVVDFSVPPEDVWRPLIAAAELESRIKLMPSDFNPEQPTFVGNCNGGVYVIPQCYVEPLRQSWLAWAKYCLERPEMLGRYHHHSDQLAFGMAVAAQGLPFSPLELKDNFPLGNAQHRYRVLPEHDIWILHYHGEMGLRGLIRRQGLPWIDRVIDRANSNLRLIRREWAGDVDVWRIKMVWAIRFFRRGYVQTRRSVWRKLRPLRALFRPAARGKKAA